MDEEARVLHLLQDLGDGVPAARADFAGALEDTERYVVVLEGGEWAGIWGGGDGIEDEIAGVE